MIHIFLISHIVITATPLITHHPTLHATPFSLFLSVCDHLPPPLSLPPPSSLLPKLTLPSSFLSPPYVPIFLSSCPPPPYPLPLHLLPSLLPSLSSVLSLHLCSIGLLLCIIFYSYAIIGMEVFHDTVHENCCQR